MKSSMDNIAYRAMKNDDDYNCLYLPYDGLFERMLESSGINFYNPNINPVQVNHNDEWPINCMTFQDMSSITNRFDLDCIIMNSREQAAKFSSIPKFMHLPSIMVDHQLPNASISSSIKLRSNEYISPNTTVVATSELVVEHWDYNDMDHEFIPYGFEKQELDYQKQIDVLVLGEFQTDNLRFLHDLQMTHSSVWSMGFNKGATSEYDNYTQLINEIKKARVCIVASHTSCPPILAMIAMSCGCTILSNDSPWSRNLLSEDRLYTDVLDVKSKLKRIFKEDNCDAEGQANIDFIQENYNMENFTNSWRNLLNRTSLGTYKQ